MTDNTSMGVHPKGYVCYRATEAVTIDGRLDKAVWQNAAWTDDFVDIEGDAKPLPRFRTRAKMLWDDTFLYIGAELEEPHVWATLTEHDAVIFQDNDFEVFIDPDGDNHDYYELEINALNTTWDLRLVKPYRDGGPALNSWEIPGFRSAVHIDGTLNDARDSDRGWSVEMAFPWAALGEYANCAAPPRDGDQWRLNFSRVEWDIDIVDGQYHKIPDRPEHNWVWSPQSVVDMHRPERWGYLQFSAAAPGSVAFRPDPAWEAKVFLHRLYEAQREFHARHQHWAASPTELSLSPHDLSLYGNALVLDTTPHGYYAMLLCRLPEGATQRWRIREDSRLWEE